MVPTWKYLWGMEIAQLEVSLMDSRKTCVSELFTLPMASVLLRHDFAFVAGAGKSIFWYINLLEFPSRDL
jgi:hypothetical protein